MGIGIDNVISRDNDMDKKAVIWDLDGVIVDTIPYHLEAWRQLFNKRGKWDFEKADYREIFGQRNEDTIKKVFGKEISSQELAALSEEKDEYFRLYIKSRNIKPMPGAVELLSLLKERGFNQALVSSSSRKNLELLISSLGISRNFEAIVCGEDVAQGKPDPEGFLLAAKKMGVEERRCIVIEDTVTGIRAAKRAGMKCLAVAGTYDKELLTEADIVVKSLKKVTAIDFEMLLK